MSLKDGFAREQRKRRDNGVKEKMEWPEDAEELIIRYGNRYEFDRCYVYENLNKFDTGVKRCCGLANRAVE